MPLKVREVTCKTALSRSRLPGLDYALNPYRGCQIACVYCYAPEVLRETRDWGRFVDVKRNISAVLARELKRMPTGVVGIGTVTDPYQPIESRYRVTRHCLEQLLKKDFPVSIQTKSSLVLRDLDLLKRFTQADVGITVTTLDDEARRLYEPFSSPPERRIEALRRLAKEGVKTWAFVGPILPGATGNSIRQLTESIAGTGVKRILVDKFRIRPGILSRTVRALEKNEKLRTEFKVATDKTGSYFGEVIARIKEDAKSRGLECVDAFPEGW